MNGEAKAEQEVAKTVSGNANFVCGFRCARLPLES